MRKTLVITLLAMLCVGFLSEPAGSGASNVPQKKWTVAGIRALVRRAERLYHLPRHMLDSIIRVESGYRIGAVNPNTRRGVAVSSFGLGQLTFETALTHCNLAASQIHNVAANIMCSAKVLEDQLNRYKAKADRIAWAVAAYNSGTPCVCDGATYIKTLPFFNRDTGVVELEDQSCRKRSGAALTCRPDEQGKFWNQEYVDKFRGNFTKL